MKRLPLVAKLGRNRQTFIVADYPKKIGFDLLDDPPRVRFCARQEAGSRTQVAEQFARAEWLSNPFPIRVWICSGFRRQVMPNHVEVGKGAKVAAQLCRTSAERRRKRREQSNFQTGAPNMACCAISGLNRTAAIIFFFAKHCGLDRFYPRVHEILRGPLLHL